MDPGSEVANPEKLAEFLRWQALRVRGPLRQIAQDPSTGPVPLAAAHAADGLQRLLGVIAAGQVPNIENVRHGLAEMRAARGVFRGHHRQHRHSDLDARRVGSPPQRLNPRAYGVPPRTASGRCCRSARGQVGMTASTGAAVIARTGGQAGLAGEACSADYSWRVVRRSGVATAERLYPWAPFNQEVSAAAVSATRLPRARLTSSRW